MFLAVYLLGCLSVYSLFYIFQQSDSPPNLLVKSQQNIASGPLHEEQTYSLKKQGSLLPLIDFLKSSDSVPTFDFLKNIRKQDVVLLQSSIPVIASKVVLELGFESALEQSRSLPPELQAQVDEFIFLLWSIESPIEALNLLAITSDYEGMDYLVMENWAEYNVVDLFENVSQLPTLMRSDAEFLAMKTFSKTAPQKVLELLPIFSNTLLEQDIIIHFAETWAHTSYEDTLEWLVNSDMSLATRNNAIKNVLRIAAHNNPQNTFTLATQLESSNDSVGNILSLTVIDAIAEKNPLAAKELAPQVNHINAWISIGRGFINVKNWDEVFIVPDSLYLNETEVDKYWNFIVEYWGFHSPQTLYKYLDEVPEKNVSNAALQVALHNRWYRFLDSNDMSRIKSYLSKEDINKYDEIVRSGDDHFLTVLDYGPGFAKTYTLDEVLAALHRDSIKKADVYP